MKFLHVIYLSLVCHLAFAGPELEVQTEDKNGVRWLYFVVNGVEQIYGADLELKYDHQQVQVVDVDNKQSGIQVARGALFGEQAYEVSNYADPRTGTVRIAASILYPAEPVSGSGAVAVVGFIHSGKGVGKVEVSRLQLGDKEGRLTEVSYPKTIAVEKALSAASSEQQPIGAYVPGTAQLTNQVVQEKDNMLIYAVIALLLVIVILLAVLLLRRPKPAV